MDVGNVNLIPWKPTRTPLPEKWVAFVERLSQEAKNHLHISPIYILDVRYNAKHISDRLREWQVPWHAIMAAYLWEYDKEYILRSGLSEAEVVVQCIRQAEIYARAIESEDLLLLLTPPYEDLGALLLATAIYFQTLKILHEKNGDRPYDVKKRTSIESISLVLRNIFKLLGIWTLKREVEDLGEQLCAPHSHKMQKKDLTDILRRDNLLVGEARRLLMDAYQKAAQRPMFIELQQCGIVGLKRRQQSQSIISPDVPINGFDLITFNVIVPTVQDCYTAFGVFSQLGQIQGGIVDQLTNPKANGSSNIYFRLLLKLPDKLPHVPGYANNPVYLCRIQIATQLMHAITWYGCLHPDCRPLYTKSQQEIEHRTLSVDELWHSEEGKVFPSIRENLASSSVLLNAQAPIVVFDKDHRRVSLPAKATALDFAYTIDPAVGEYAAEAFVNYRKSPLYRELDAGDIVEIRTANYVQTQQEWLDRNYARTPKARQEIQKSLQRHPQKRKGYNQLREILDRNHYMLTPEALEQELRQLVKQHHLGTHTEYIRLLDIRKDVRYTPEWAAHQMMEQISERNDIPPTEMTKMSWTPVLNIPTNTQKNRINRKHLCGFCKPEYPHTIMGRIRKSTGELVVHRERCPHLLDSYAKLLSMDWQPQGAPFCVSLYMITQDRKGLVSDFTRVLRSHQCDLRYVQAEAIDGGQAMIRFKVEVHADKEVFAIRDALKKREPHAHIEIDAATTPQHVFHRLRSHHRQEELWDTSALENAFNEVVAVLPPRRPYLRNPFNISRPAAPKMFFGRSREMATLQESLCESDLGKAVILYGPLRSGKSSICTNFIEQHILFDRHAAQPTWGLVCSLQNALWHDEETIFFDLAGRIGRKFAAQFQQAAPRWQDFEERDPQARFRSFLLECIARVPHSRFILVLDEFGGAIEAFLQEKLDFRFFTLWRELLNEVQQLSLLFALPTSSYYLLSSTRFSHVFSFAQSIKVRYLDEIGAQQLLVDPLNQQHIAVHHTTVALARRLTGGSPYYMAMFGQQLIELLNRENHIQQIFDDELLGVIDLIIQENTGNNFDFLKQELLNEEERTILKAIVELTRQIKQTKVQCKVIADRLKMPIYTVRQHLDRLRDGQVLDEIGPLSNPFYSFKIELQRRWLSHHREFFTT